MIMRKDTDVVIVDRNPHIRAFLRREMRRIGLKSGSAGTWAELKIVLSRVEPGLVVLSPDLPDMRGRALISRLAERFPGIPVLVHAMEPDVLKGVLPPWMDVLPKAGATDPLVRRVRELLS